MLIIVNFKTYEQGTGKNAIRLAKKLEKVANKNKANVVLAVQPTDLLAVASNVNLPVLAQHVDACKYGANTGAILPESIMAAGAVGSLVNHSEHKLPLQVIKETINRLKKLGLISVVCAANTSIESKIAKLNPDILAVEPPSLIGGKISVSKAKPKLIEESVKRAGKTALLVGAGVHTTQDVAVALKLGARGVLVASGIVKAKDPAKELKTLINGFQQ